MSPNPTVISQSKESEEDRSFWKAIILAFLAAFFAWSASFLFNRFILIGQSKYIIATVVAAVFFLILLILKVFFVKNSVKLGFLVFFESIFFLVPFYKNLYPQPSIALLVGGLAAFIFFIAGALKGQQQLANSLEIKFFSVSRGILRKSVTGLLLFFVLVLYLNYFTWGNFNERLGRTFVEGTLVSAEPFLKIISGDINFNQNVNDFFNSIAENQLKKIKIEGEKSGVSTETIDFQELPPVEKTKLINEVGLTIKKEAEKIIGPLEITKSVKEEIFRLIKNYVVNLPEITKTILELVFVVSLFFGIKGIATLLYWLVEVFAFLIFKFLIITGFAYVSLETRSREFILLS